MTEVHDGLFISGKPLREWKGEYDDFQGALNIILNKVEALPAAEVTPLLDYIGRVARSALTGGQ